MNEIDIRSRPPSSSQMAAQRDGHESNGESFARSLRQLESLPEKAGTSANARPLMTAMPEPVDAFNVATDMPDADIPDERDKTEDVNPVPGGAGAQALLPAKPSSESTSPDDGLQIDLASSSLALQAVPPADITTVETLSTASSVMSLNDFTALLQQAGLPANTGREQVWRFTLQDPGLPLAQIALTGGSVGHWSVALKAQGSDEQTLAQHLQRLRTRLDEKLGQGVTHVTITWEETP